MTTPASSRRWLLWPLVGAAAARLACLPLAKVLPRWGDANGYLYLAQQFRESGSMAPLPSGIRPPLSRMLIAPGLDTSVSPADPFPGVFLIQILLALAACALLMIITRRLFGRRAATAAGWIYALYPQAIVWSSTVIMVETVAVLMGAAILLVLDGLVRSHTESASRSWRHGALLGVVLGIGILMREQLVSAAAATGLVLLLTPGSAFWARVLLATEVALIALVIITPWARHNETEHGVPLLSGSYSQLGLLLENAPPGESGIQMWLAEETLEERIALARSTFRRALSEYPGLTAQRALFRLRVLLGPEVMLPIYFAIPYDGITPTVTETYDLFHQYWSLPGGSTGRAIQILCGIAVLIVFGLAAAGLAATGPSTPRRLALVMIVLVLVSIALTVGTARYRHSLLAFCIPFAGHALSLVLERGSRPALEPRQRRLALRWGLGVAALLALTLFVLPAPAIP